MLILPRGKSLHRATLAERLGIILAYLDLFVARYGGQNGQFIPSGKSVPLEAFRQRGIEDDILLWMLYQEHIEHIQLGLPVNSLLMVPESSFRMTDRGEAFLYAFLGTLVPDAPPQPFAAILDNFLLGPLQPHYDEDGRLFGWGRHILNQFSQPAGNQTLTLLDAEEQSWPAWMDDPLPPRNTGRKTKVRLHDTIKDINRGQKLRFIRFKGNGTGRRLGWRYR